MNKIRGIALSLPMVAMALLLNVAGCGDDDDPTNPPAGQAPYDLNFTGTAAPHANQTLRVLVIKDSDGSIVKNDTQVIAADGTFSFAWPDLLAGNTSYHIDFFADHNGNGECDGPPTDHSWRLALGTVTGDMSRDFQHSVDFTEVCDSFEFNLRFTATLLPHAGQTLHVAVVPSGSASPVVTDQADVAADGSIAFTWNRLLEEGHEYTIDFYADVNGNAQCDAPPTDHAWRIALDAVHDHVERDFQHNTQFTDVCGSF